MKKLLVVYMAVAMAAAFADTPKFEDFKVKPEFVQAVEKDYVLVFIDHPQNRGLLSARAKKENPKHMKKYGIAGVPHALILDGDGNKVGETGYRKGGAAAPEIPMLRLKEISFYDALKFVCARVDYTFEINYASDLGDVIVTIKPRDNSKSSDAK